MASSHRIFSTSASGWPLRAAISAADCGLRISRNRATSAISSVTTGSRILYSGSLGWMPFLEPIFLRLTLLANSKTFILTGMSLPRWGWSGFVLPLADLGAEPIGPGVDALAGLGRNRQDAHFGVQFQDVLAQGVHVEIED